MQNFLGYIHTMCNWNLSKRIGRINFWKPKSVYNFLYRKSQHFKLAGFPYVHSYYALLKFQQNLSRIVFTAKIEICYDPSPVRRISFRKAKSAFNFSNRESKLLEVYICITFLSFHNFWGTSESFLDLSEALVRSDSSHIPYYLSKTLGWIWWIYLYFSFYSWWGTLYLMFFFKTKRSEL